MAKIKNQKNKFRTAAPKSSVVSPRPFLINYKNWKHHRPEWVEEIKNAIDKADIQKAKRLLEEKEIQKNLASLNDISDIYFSRYEIALQLVRTFQGERALQYCLDTLKLAKSVEIYNTIALIYNRMGKFALAIEYLQRAEQLEPGNIAIWNNRAGCLMKVGRTKEAVDLLRKAIAANPQYEDAYSNLLLNLNYLHDVEISEIYEESKKWAQIQAPVNFAAAKHDNTLEPHRKIRIGYISPDFRVHSVLYFFDSLLLCHDRNQFEIYCYGDVISPDEGTKKVIEMCDCYRNIVSVEDADAAKLIKSDAIDILVDLAGHTGRNRLGVLAYKPAPIQVTYLGYPNTTGMPQVDYRFTDEIADTSDQQQFYTEKLVYLPNGFLCYNPGDIQPPIRKLPSLERKYILFGCCNNPKKINPVIVKIWVDLMKQVPDSKLLLKFKEGEDQDVREYIWNLFAEQGMQDPKKDVMIFGPISYEAHLDTYNSIDIALDTYPYNGTTTTCQALLMGVPVITLTGKHHGSRVGLDILSRLDMQFFSAQSAEEYVKKAAALAAKPDALAQIRATMRQRLAASPLCNYELITSDIENAYRKMWHDYCLSKGIDISQNQIRQEPGYAPKRFTPPSALDLMIKADNFFRQGRRSQAVECATDALNKFSSKSISQKPPQYMLERYHAAGPESLLFNLCAELFAYSSYFAAQSYWKLYCKIKKLCPSDIEIDFRFALLAALQSKLKNEKLDPQWIKVLESLDQKLNNQRSRALLGLAKGDLKQLSLPYDMKQIHLYPDLDNITTYVLLEQADWFEKSDLDVFRSLIRPQDVVFDLGANVGVYSLSAAARTSGKVIAVEPAGRTFELLNASATQFQNMTAVHAAISDKPGTAFLSHGGSSENHKLSRQGGLGEQVPLITVDALAKKHDIDQVDIIKMDVEGHELKALAGAQKIIAAGSPVIFYEVKHGSDWHFELIDAFNDLGYDSYFTLPYAKTPVKYNKGMDLDEYLLNMIAVRPESVGRFNEQINSPQLQASVL